MHTLYDSDTFNVTHVLANATEPAAHDGGLGQAAADVAQPVVHILPRHGFDIIDKRAGKEIYLDGSWAELFQQQIIAWQTSTPTQEEVEDTLEGYASLAQNPVVMH